MSNGENGNTGKMEDTIFVDKSKEFKNVSESVGESSKTLPTTEKEENKCNEEVEENKCNEIKRKRGRPSEKDKECLPDKEGLPESRNGQYEVNFAFFCRIHADGGFLCRE